MHLPRIKANKFARDACIESIRSDLQKFAGFSGKYSSPGIHTGASLPLGDFRSPDPLDFTALGVNCSANTSGLACHPPGTWKTGNTEKVR